VDEVQALLEQAVYKPVQGRFKVFMIDEVHMLTGHAFNAMLKTLEEPPDYLKFVLATTDPQKVPVTVLSRCLQFNLRPMAPATIFDHLQQVLATEGVACDLASLHLIARAARGSMRDALSLTDQAIAFGAGQVSESAVRQMLGSVDRSYVFSLIEALAAADGRAVVETVENLRVQGLNAASALEEMASVLHGMAVQQAMGESSDLSKSGDPQEGEIARLSTFLPPDETQLLYSICLHGRADLGLAPDEYAALTMVLLRLLAFKPTGSSQSGAGLSVEKKSLKSGAEPSLSRSQSLLAPPPTPPRPAADPAQPEPAVQANVLEVAIQTARHEPKAREAGRLELEQTSPAIPALPPGQLLAVHEQDSNSAIAAAHLQDSKASAAIVSSNGTQMVNASGPVHRVVGVPMRVQQESRLDQSSNAQIPGFTETEHGDFWHHTVQALVQAQAINALTRELALQSQLIGRDEDAWILRVESESLNQSGSRDRLRQALQGAGHAVALTVEVGRVVDSPARRNATASAERQLAAEETIRSHPLVQTWIRDFGAKIVPGSIRPL
jgi:DNA polymerase-3 subunit gamma/tau